MFQNCKLFSKLFHCHAITFIWLWTYMILPVLQSNECILSSNTCWLLNEFLKILNICVNWRENIPLIAEGKAELNPLIHSSVMIYAFWGLIGFWYFQVFSINWARSNCREIAINGLNIDFRMLWCVWLCAFPEL